MLSDRSYCGFQHNDDRFDSNNSTALDEYPWLVHILFADVEDEYNHFRDRCNGVLINNRYVLTTKYCAIFPESVKLGQYDTNRTISCVNNTDLEECNEPILKIPVENEIFRVDTLKGLDDFALLRLAEKVTFTDYIRPICLPLDDSEVIERSELFFSGWGAHNESNITKKKLKYRPTDLSKCLELDVEKSQVPSSVVPVCLKPERNNTVLVCSGDGSGPAMYSNKRMQWFADSIITKVYYDESVLNLCSNKMPIAGIKITMDVVEWILSVIRP
ncbi:hypothetical protein FQR65_LT02160 [Abscondita terminalis]|nr:hypothetical protein FQR65_LT02160 [Abscondita terminalis]